MQILHGDNQSQSRASFIALKEGAAKKDLDVLTLAGEDLDINTLVQSVASASLFGKTNSVFIESFFSRRPSGEKKKIQEYLASHTKEDITLWEPKDVTAQLKEFPVTLVKKFDVPKHVFKYLDTLALSDLELSLQNTAPELIFSLLAGQIRKLVMVQDNVTAALPSWQVGKLKGLANRFTLQKLLIMHRQLLDMDYKLKTSGSALDLSAALEVWTIGLTSN